METVFLVALGLFAFAVVGKKVVGGLRVAWSPKVGAVPGVSGGRSDAGGGCGTGCDSCGSSGNSARS